VPGGGGGVTVPVGVTAAEGDDATPVPTALVAATVKVTGIPLVSPVTTPLVAGAATVSVCPVEAATR
jgi:hypothetical protein